jgi:hypothetical protein
LAIDGYQVHVAARDQQAIVVAVAGQIDEPEVASSSSSMLRTEAKGRNESHPPPRCGRDSSGTGGWKVVSLLSSARRAEVGELLARAELGHRRL